MVVTKHFATHGKKYRRRLIKYILNPDKTDNLKLVSDFGMSNYLDFPSYEEDDYYLEFELEEDCTIPESFPETGLLDFSKRQPMLSKTRILDLNYELFQHDALTFDNLKSRKVALKTKNHQKGLKVSFEDFPFLVVWTTTNKGPFIALEPWSGLSTSLTETDNFIDKTHVTYVEKGEVSRKAFTIEIR